MKRLANKVCGKLPEGWQINICLSLNSGWVELENPDGDFVELSPDHQTEGGIAAAVENALKVAKEQASSWIDGEPTES